MRFVQSIVKSIDPIGRRVETDGGAFDADVLVVALGADIDPAAMPGLVEGGHEFYSVAGAAALRDMLLQLERGAAIIDVTSKTFKCPPAPSEAALLHDDLTARGQREATDISVVMPFGTPIPRRPIPLSRFSLPLRSAAHPVRERQPRVRPRPRPEGRRC